MTETRGRERKRVVKNFLPANILKPHYVHRIPDTVCLPVSDRFRELWVILYILKGTSIAVMESGQSAQIMSIGSLFGRNGLKIAKGEEMVLGLRCVKKGQGVSTLFSVFIMGIQVCKANEWSLLMETKLKVSQSCYS